MIKSVTAINPLGRKLVMELGNPWASGFVVSKIDGLGPVKADINVTRLATLDGAFYNSAKVGPRNIVMNLIYLENPSIEATRRLSYEMFPLKKKIYLEIETDTRVYETHGYVESNEPDIFSNMETAVISIVCPNAYFNSGPAENEGYEYVNFYQTKPKFEFPFGNESLTTKMLELGALDISLSRVIDYQGDVSTGFEVIVKAISSGADFRIYNVATNDGIELSDSRIAERTGAGITAGDVIYISTVRGDKTLSLFRGGNEWNIINSLKMGANWPMLVNGSNYLAYSSTNATNMRIQIRYKPLYEGI